MIKYVDPEIVVDGTVWVPCPGGCGWCVPVSESDKRPVEKCYACATGTPHITCQCRGCRGYPASYHDGVFDLH